MVTVLLDVTPVGPLGIGLGELMVIGGVCCLVGLPTIAGIGLLLYLFGKKNRGDG